MRLWTKKPENVWLFSENILQLATEYLRWGVIQCNFQIIIFRRLASLIDNKFPAQNWPQPKPRPHQMTIFQMRRCWWPCWENLPTSQSSAGYHPNSGPEPFLQISGKMFVWSGSWNPLLGTHNVWKKKKEKKSSGCNAAGMKAFLACRSEQIIVHLLWTNLSGRGSVVWIVLLMEGKTFLHIPSFSAGSVLELSRSWVIHQLR